MEIVSLFKDFGYPALMSGVLLWMLTVKLEKLSSKVDELKNLITLTQANVNECREALKDLGEERKPR